MKRVIVRYKVKADRADENVAFIEKVFAELEANAPEGLRYASFRGDDGVTFVHIALIETADGKNPLDTPAFQAFTENIKERCDEPPMAMDVTLVGSYRLL